MTARACSLPVLCALLLLASLGVAAEADPPEVGLGDGWTLRDGERERWVEDVRVGTAVVYVVDGVQRRSDRTGGVRLEPVDGTLLPDARIDANTAYDVVYAVTAVEGRTGERRWTRLLHGRPNLAIDPRDDGLWLWSRRHGRAQKLDAATGRVEETFDLPEHRHSNAEYSGLRHRGTRIWGAASRNVRDPIGTEYELGSGLELGGLAPPWITSPSGLRVVRTEVSQSPTGVSVAFAALPPRVEPGRRSAELADWIHEVSDYVGSLPWWMPDGDVLIQSGHLLGEAAVTRLDGVTGRPRWSTPLGSTLSVTGPTGGRPRRRAAGRRSSPTARPSWCPGGRAGRTAFTSTSWTSAPAVFSAEC